MRRQGLFFGNETALSKLDDLESSILKLAENPYIGTDPRYMVLKRQSYVAGTSNGKVAWLSR